MRNQLLHIVVHSLYVVVALLSLSASAVAGDHGCARCGCANCCKVCRLVEETKKVPVICWGMKCEDFCQPGPSCRGCKNSEEVCQSTEKDADGPCVAPKNFVWYDWIPGGSKGIATKKKLMKKTVTKTVPSFKWVVEDLCAECEAKTENAVVPPGVAIPPPPKVDPK
jgi:hypothetical protein